MWTTFPLQLLHLMLINPKNGKITTMKFLRVWHYVVGFNDLCPNNLIANAFRNYVTSSCWQYVFTSRPWARTSKYYNKNASQSPLIKFIYINNKITILIEMCVCVCVCVCDVLKCIPWDYCRILRTHKDDLYLCLLLHLVIID